MFKIAAPVIDHHDVVCSLHAIPCRVGIRLELQAIIIIR